MPKGDHQGEQPATKLLGFPTIATRNQYVQDYYNSHQGKRGTITSLAREFSCSDRLIMKILYQQKSFQRAHPRWDTLPENQSNDYQPLDRETWKRIRHKIRHWQQVRRDHGS